ncbi:MAG: type II secretion system protein [Planctomycetota bacterium]
MRTGSRPTRSFTLIELMVVIAIIGILVSLTVVGVMSAITSGKVGKTHSLITALKAGLEGFSSPSGPGGGTYPPATLNTWGLSHDSTNTGIETLLMCLRTRKGGGPFFNINDWSNMVEDRDDEGTDAGDSYQYFDIDSTKTTLLEIVDPWGNPLVYVPRDQYDTDFTILDANDEFITIRASYIDTGTGELPAHYVIWSFGPNGINEYGGGDDIPSWQQGNN